MGMGRDRQGQAGTVHTLAPSTGKNHAWLQVNNYKFIFIVIDLDVTALSREHHSEPICIDIHMILQGAPSIVQNMWVKGRPWML